MKKNKSSQDGIKIIAQNKKARFEYFVEDSMEAGVVLLGSEVKSLRDGRASLSDSYAMIEYGECFLVNSHIADYQPASYMNHNPKRTRKLLLHAKEIEKLKSKLDQRGYTLIPLKLYFKKGRAKVELGLCKGKKQYDKRAAIKKRESDRDLRRAVQRKY